MPRKCFEPGGFVYEFLDGEVRTIAPNVAGREKTGRFGAEEWRDLTWDEVMQRRRERQAEQLERIRGRNSKPTVLPCYVWTFFNRQDFPFHGWYCYVVTREFGDVAVRGKHGDNEPLRESIMTEIPCGLLPMAENFEAWMAAFARKHPRRQPAFSRGHRDPRKSGCHLGWLNDERTFSLQRPNDL